MNTDVDLIIKINELYKSNKNGNVYLYPNYTNKCNGNIYEPIKLNDKQLEHIKNIIKISQTFQLTEKYYRDLVQINLTFVSDNASNKNEVLFAKKIIVGKECNGNLIIATTFQKIDSSEFPVLSTYREDNKTINVLEINEKNIGMNLELTELLLINDSLCINIKIKPTSSTQKKTLRKELTNIIDFMQNVLK